jgi:alpha-L-rhamnosidase
MKKLLLLQSPTVTMILLLLSIPVIQRCASKATLPPAEELICEYRQDPIGIDRTNPQLSWKIPDYGKGIMQTAYEVLVASSLENLNDNKGDMWSTGKVSSDQSVFVTYDGQPLESRKKYFWKVKYWDNKGGESTFSSPASWEMALLNSADWQASWITRSGAETRDDSLRSTMMRKTFTAENSIAQARLYVTGLGNYKFYINGQKVDEDILTPGWTHYPDRLQYQVYDVTDLVKNGENVAGAMLGNAWWSGGLGWGRDPNARKRYSYGPMKLLAQLEIEDDSGNIQTIRTDATWKWDESPITFNNLYDGVHYDARLEQEGWAGSSFDDGSWQAVAMAEKEAAILVAQQGPPIRAEQELTAKSITKAPNGNWVFDFGQNMVGWGKLKVAVPEGTEIKMKFSELLHEDGTVAQENLRSAKATDIYISKDDNEVIWEPIFTYSGFRYIEMEGFPGEPNEETLKGVVFYSSAPWIGSFDSSNDLINQLMKNTSWGIRGNLHSVPTDCPQRDERLGWMGDAQTFAPTCYYNMDMTRFYEKWMKDILDSQDESGYVYDVNPAIVVSGPAKPGWGDAVIITPWVAYKFSGNERILEENYDGMKAWVEFMRRHAKDNIYIWANPDSTFFGYADWIAPVLSPKKPISASYLFLSSKLLSEIAAVIGKPEDAAEYAQLASDVASAYQEKYFNQETQNYEGGTQTANLLPLGFGITPEELKDQVFQNVVDAVNARDGHPSTGFLGTQYVLPTLSDYGRHDMAYEMINLRTYPSWGYMVEKGATTIWELWNSDTERPEGMNSRNHYALGGIGEWVYGYLGGLKPDIEHPGFKQSLIAPRPVGDLTWAKTTRETAYGDLLVDWKIEGNVFHMDVAIPPNTTSIVTIPKTGISFSVITIDGTEVFREGNGIDNIDTIQFIAEDENGVSFKVGSGSYSFMAD